LAAFLMISSNIFTGSPKELYAKMAKGDSLKLNHWNLQRLADPVRFFSGSPRSPRSIMVVGWLKGDR
jgi:hypothetical protein